MENRNYPFITEPLSEADGGGWISYVPDLPGCMSDGDTPQASAASVLDAIAAWIDEAKATGRPIPPPSRHIQAAE